MRVLTVLTALLASCLIGATHAAPECHLGIPDRLIELSTSAFHKFKNKQFRDALEDLSAALQLVPKDEDISDERSKRHVSIASARLSILSYAAKVATSNTHSLSVARSLLQPNSQLLHKMSTIDAALSVDHLDDSIFTFQDLMQCDSPSAFADAAVESLEPTTAQQPHVRRVAVVIPTHPPMFLHARNYLLSCAHFNCTSAVDTYFVFTDSVEQDLFHSMLPPGTSQGSFHSLICGKRCLAGSSAPNSKKFYGLHRLLELAKEGRGPSYKYAVCFDSETVFVRDPGTLYEGIEGFDRKKQYYMTRHEEAVAHNVIPALALDRWGVEPAKMQTLLKETDSFRLHGWWTSLPVYDMDILPGFFEAYVGENIHSVGGDMERALILTAAELENLSFEHNVYKYYTIMNHGWRVVNLHERFPFVKILDDLRSWIEIYADYIPSMEQAVEVINDTAPLWVPACMPRQMFHDQDVYFQFHADKCGVCNGTDHCNTYTPWR